MPRQSHHREGCCPIQRSLDHGYTSRGCLHIIADHSKFLTQEAATGTRNCAKRNRG